MNTISSHGSSENRTRKKRLQLNCGECRKKKLSCDRKLPCSRCVRTGRPDECSFERSQPPVSRSQLPNQDTQHQKSEMQALREEIDQLKRLVSKPHFTPKIQNISDSAGFNEAPDTNSQGPIETIVTELSDPRDRSPRGYYNQHTLLEFFTEIPQLFPFIKETSDEWFKPRGINLRKNKSTKMDPYTVSDRQPPLESLLPPKNDTDVLIGYYLTNFECIHRIVHIPTFQREYSNYWTPGNTRYSAMTALILSMISLSVVSRDSTSSTYRAMPLQWIAACTDWLNQQSSKHRKLVHYQVSCLIYLAKRMNMIKKKTWWKDTAALIQDAIMDGLHCDSSPIDSHYTRGMKRRIWYTIRELDLQNSFEYGIPTLLHTIESNVVAPLNINDEEFHETSKELCISKSPNQFTFASYQSQSSRSWELRLDISRRLYSTGTSNSLNYEDVLRYSHEINQMLGLLPSWEKEKIDGEDNLSLLAYAYLSFQLKECILSIHRPYLQQLNGKFWLSENITYQISREILLLNSRLGRVGIQNLTLLREDLLLASLSITRITLLQPKCSSGIIMASSEETINLLEQCLPFTEQRYLGCFYGEPWCFLTMYAAIMLLKLHVGKETPESARSSCARQFLDLYYKHIGRQQEIIPIPHLPIYHEPGDMTENFASYQQPTSACNQTTSERPDSNFSDIHLNFLDHDMDFGGHLWESWDLA